MSEKDLKNVNSEVKGEEVNEDVEGYCRGDHVNCNSSTVKRCLSDCLFSSPVYTCEK